MAAVCVAMLLCSGAVHLSAAQELPHAQNPQDAGLGNYEALVNNHHFSEAETGLRDFLSHEPNSAPAHFLLGYVLYRENKPKDSLAEYTQGAKFRNPGSADLAAVAMDYILLHDYPDADRWLTQAAKAEPANYLYRYYLGRTQYSENHFSDAIESFEKCLALRPADEKAEFNIGLAYSGMGDETKAEAAYRQSIAWQNKAQEDPQPYLDLGILLLHQNKIDAALTPLEEAARIDPRNPRIHEELGAAYEKLGRLPAAQKSLEEAVSLADDIPALHFELGRVYKKQGMTEKAQAQFSRFAALNAAHSSDATPTPNPPKHD